jgi:hypothetical protein
MMFGSWVAQFECDLSTVEHINAEQSGPDSTTYTTFFWSTPPPPPEPSLQVEINHDWVQGWGWPSGHLIRLFVNGVEMDAQVVYDVPWGTEVGFSEWDTGFEYDLQPGDVVTLEDTVTGETKAHTALDIAITDVDVGANTVTGEAVPGSELIIEAHDPCGERISVTADGGGYWAASFGCALIDVEHIHAEQHDPDDTTYTSFFWSPPPPPPEPSFQVELNHDWVVGYEWPSGHLITLIINGDEIDTQEVVDFPWGTEVNFNEWDTGFVYDIQPGDVVTLEDKATGETKTHTAFDIAITEVNVIANTVHGHADPGSELFVWAHWPCDEGVWVTADVMDGSWTANFACDLNTVEHINAEQYDSNWMNWTTFFWSPTPPPTLYAEINFEWVDGWYWPLGDDVTLTIMEPGNPEPLLTRTETVGMHDGDDQAYVRFDLWEEGFNLQPGHIVTLTNGPITKTHTALNIGITQVNVTNNTVTGYAERDATLMVSAHSPCWDELEVVANGTDYIEEGYAYWQADFSGICELSTIERGHAAQQGLEEGTSTGFYWETPNVEVNILYDFVVGRSWLPGTDVTLTIDGPDIQGTENFTRTETVGADPESSSDTVQFDFGGDFYVVPGHIVTLSDGGVTIVYEVEYLEVTKVDYDNNILEGLAAPNDELLVIFGDTWTEEVVYADQTGKWSIYHEDLASEVWGMVRTPAEDGNNTSSGWDGPIPTTYNINPWWSDVRIRTEDEVILNLGWGACTSGLVKAFQQAARIDITINGEPLYPEGDDDLYWGPIEPMELDGCKAAPEGDQASVSRWQYTFSPFETGIYEVDVHYWLAHPIIDGGDWDGDGKMDQYEGTLVENMIMIIVK